MPVVREGSSLHYSLLWTAKDARDRFLRRLALIQAMATTLDEVQEPSVAEKKIHWWHEELQRLHDGTARHPSTQLNQRALENLVAAQSACLDIVSVASSQRFTPPQTIESAQTDLERSFKARLALLTHALSNDTADLDCTTHPSTAALAFALYEQLQRLPALIHRGLPVFSDELYKRFNIRPHDLAEHIRVSDAIDASSTPDDIKSTASGVLKKSNTLNNIPVVSDKPGRAELLRHAISHCQSTFVTAINNSDCKQRYRRGSALPIWRLLVLRKHQLDLWHKHQPDLLRERSTLTPLMKFFRAWQHRR
jgi:hypothetical protein